MKKFLFMFLLAAAAVSASTFVFAQEETEEGKKFTIHGEIRQRGDFNDNLSDFTSDSDDSFLFYPYRARIGAEGHFGKDVVGYVEFQTFGVWGDTPPIAGFQFGPVFGDNETNPFQPPFTGVRTNVLQNTSSDLGFISNRVELYEGYIALTKIRGSNFSLKFGRQEIVKGSEMLLGDNDFYSGLSHDGVMACWSWDKFDLDIWGSRPLQSGGILATPDHQSVNFYGAWAQWGKWESGADVAAYALYYEDGTLGPTTNRRAFWTIGGRTGRDVSGRNAFNWNAELAYQTGDQNDGVGADDNIDVKAIALEGMLEYNLHSGSFDHRFHVMGASASGDDDPADEDAETFDPLFQDSHGRYGMSDLFTLSDLTVVGLGYNVRYREHQFGGDVYNYKLAEDVTTAAGTDEDALGNELDLWWKYQYSRNAQVMFAGAWFKPGDAIEDEVETGTGLSTDAGVRLLGNLRLRF